MKAFNQEKALVGAFSVIVQLYQLIDLRHYCTAAAHNDHPGAAAQDPDQIWPDCIFLTSPLYRELSITAESARGWGRQLLITPVQVCEVAASPDTALSPTYRRTPTRSNKKKASRCEVRESHLSPPYPLTS